jgi:hypothetical protein
METDPTYPYVLKVLVAKETGVAADIERAEAELEEQRTKHEATLPPEKRLNNLRKKLRSSEASIDKLEVRVMDIQTELDSTADRLHDAQLGLRSERARASSIQQEIEATEKLIEPAPGRAAPLKPGPQPASRTPLQLEEHLECIYQHFTHKYDLSEDASSQLECQLKGIESLQANLDRMRVINAAEAKLQEEAKAAANDAKASNKRERSPAPDGRERAEGKMEVVGEDAPTEVAPSDGGERELEEDPPQDSRTPEVAQTPASTPPGPTTTASGAETATNPPGAEDDSRQVPAPVLGPLATAPYGAPAPLQQAAAASPRLDRERSPRRDADVPPVPSAVTSAVPVTPPLSAAAAARLRGDSVGDSLDSLPALERTEETQSEQNKPSNARGGGPLT